MGGRCYRTRRLPPTALAGLGLAGCQTAGAYARAQANGVDCDPLLVETFGGFGPELLELLRGAAEFKMNKLSAAEYDETTWSARTWLTFAMQRISVAVHKAVAKELSDALGFSGAVDPRGAPRD